MGGTLTSTMRVNYPEEKEASAYSSYRKASLLTVQQNEDFPPNSDSPIRGCGSATHGKSPYLGPGSSSALSSCKSKFPFLVLRIPVCAIQTAAPPLVLNKLTSAGEVIGCQIITGGRGAVGVELYMPSNCFDEFTHVV